MIKEKNTFKNSTKTLDDYFKKKSITPDNPLYTHSTIDFLLREHNKRISYLENHGTAPNNYFLRGLENNKNPLSRFVIAKDFIMLVFGISIGILVGKVICDLF